jgi:hypothetical protein
MRIFTGRITLANMSELTLSYIFVAIVSVIVTAFIFRWVLGLGKLTRLIEKQHYLLRELSKKLEVDDKVIKNLNEETAETYNV